MLFPEFFDDGDEFTDDPLLADDVPDEEFLPHEPFLRHCKRLPIVFWLQLPFLQLDKICMQSELPQFEEALVQFEFAQADVHVPFAHVEFTHVDVPFVHVEFVHFDSVFALACVISVFFEFAQVDSAFVHSEPVQAELLLADEVFVQPEPVQLLEQSAVFTCVHVESDFTVSVLLTPFV